MSVCVIKTLISPFRTCEGRSSASVVPLFTETQDESIRVSTPHGHVTSFSDPRSPKAQVGPPDSGPLVLLGDPHLVSHLGSVQKRTHMDQDQRSVSAVAKLNFPPSYSGFNVPSHINLVFMKLQQVLT